MFKGDNQVPLGDICNIEKGATITRNDVLPGEVPVVAGGQEPSYYIFVSNCNILIYRLVLPSWKTRSALHRMGMET